MLCMNVIAASIIEEFDLFPNCVLGISLYWSTIYDSLLATIFSRILPRHSSSIIR